MKNLLTTLAAVGMMLSLVGCGGSSSDLPVSVLNEDAVAIEWMDLESASADDLVRLFDSLSDAQDEDDRPRTRMYLSAKADDHDFETRRFMDTLDEAGVRGLLLVHYRTSETEDDVTTFDRSTEMFILADKDAEEDAIEEAVADISGLGDSLKLEPVEDEEGWYWVSSEDDKEAELPDGGDEESAAAFFDLLDQGGTATAVVAWRRTEVSDQQLEEQLDDDMISDSREALLENLQAIDSVVLTTTQGSNPKITVTLNFNEDEAAEWYAERANEYLNAPRGDIKRSFARAPGAESMDTLPTVDEINEVMDSLEYTVRGSTVTLTMSGQAVKDLIVLQALSSITGANSDIDDVLENQFDEMGGSILGIPSDFDAMNGDGISL